MQRAGGRDAPTWGSVQNSTECFLFLGRGPISLHSPSLVLQGLLANGGTGGPPGNTEQKSRFLN